MAPAVVGIWEYEGSSQTAQLTAVGKACEADVPVLFFPPVFLPSWDPGYLDPTIWAGMPSDEETKPLRSEMMLLWGPHQKWQLETAKARCPKPLSL